MSYRRRNRRVNSNYGRKTTIRPEIKRGNPVKTAPVKNYRRTGRRRRSLVNTWTVIKIVLSVIVVIIALVWLKGLGSRDNKSNTTRNTVISEPQYSELIAAIPTIDYSSFRSTEIAVDQPVPVENAYTNDPYTQIENALRNREEQICIEDDVYHLTWADLGVMDYGSFWLSDFAHSHYSMNGHDYNTYYFYYYDLTDAQIEFMKNEIDAAYNAIVSCIPDGADDYLKAKIVHDILVASISYDHTISLDYNQNVYGGLVRGEAVCCGYACSYSYVLNRMGIPCQIVESSTHAYNKIGQTYVDVCWDDCDYTYEDGSAVIMYTYFGLDYDTVNTRPNHAVEYVSYEYSSDECIVPDYYEHEGYELSYYDYSSVISIMQEQFNEGLERLEVRFTNVDSYNDCVSSMNSELWSALADIGYTGDYAAYWSNDDELIWSVLLVPVQEQ